MAKTSSSSTIAAVVCVGDCYYSVLLFSLALSRTHSHQHTLLILCKHMTQEASIFVSVSRVYCANTTKKEITNKKFKSGTNKRHIANQQTNKPTNTNNIVRKKMNGHKITTTLTQPSMISYNSVQKCEAEEQIDICKYICLFTHAQRTRSRSQAIAYKRERIQITDARNEKIVIKIYLKKASHRQSEQFYALAIILICFFSFARSTINVLLL